MKKALAVEISTAKEILNDIRSIQEGIVILGLDDKNGVQDKLRALANEALDTLNKKLD